MHTLHIQTRTVSWSMMTVAKLTFVKGSNIARSWSSVKEEGRLPTYNCMGKQTHEKVRENIED